MNLHDWIDELSDVLDVDTELDEALVLDLARAAAHNVARPAAPITTYLLGFAAGSQGADPEAVEALAARAQALADGWDRPANAPDPDDINDPVPDDSVGDQVMAALVLRKGTGLAPSDLETFLSAQPDLSPKAWPRYVRINEDLPATATNKILKRALIAAGVTGQGGVLFVRQPRGKTYTIESASGHAKTLTALPISTTKTS